MTKPGLEFTGLQTKSPTSRGCQDNLTGLLVQPPRPHHKAFLDLAGSLRGLLVSASRLVLFVPSGAELLIDAQWRSLLFKRMWERRCGSGWRLLLAAHGNRSLSCRLPSLHSCGREALWHTCRGHAGQSVAGVSQAPCVTLWHLSEAHFSESESRSLPVIWQASVAGLAFNKSGWWQETITGW